MHRTNNITGSKQHDVVQCQMTEFQLGENILSILLQGQGGIKHTDSTDTQFRNIMSYWEVSVSNLTILSRQQSWELKGNTIFITATCYDIVII